jgi:guanine nucleotide exchange factor VAV
MHICGYGGIRKREDYADSGPEVIFKMASEDEWRLCVEWLIRCNVLPSDHEFTLRDVEVVKLAQSLRDGVLLCHLLNVLSTDCIDPKDFSPRPQMSQVKISL